MFQRGPAPRTAAILVNPILITALSGAASEAQGEEP